MSDPVRIELRGPAGLVIELPEGRTADVVIRDVDAPPPQGETRVTEDGEARVTEEGELRVLETHAAPGSDR